MLFLFVFSATTFLQTYIPLIKSCQKFNHKYLLFIRHNHKSYADVIKHKKTYLKHIKKYNLKLLPLKQLPKYKGIVILVDGDIYGPHKINEQQSCKKYLNKNHFVISFLEYFNFYWVYHKYLSYVDHVILPNKIYETFYNLNSNKTINKNLYLGAPKYDVNFNKQKMYLKFKLNPNNKYILIFYPKIDRAINIYPNFQKYFNQLIQILIKNKFHIIIKTRDKFKYKINNKHKNIKIITDNNFYPLTSLQLITISDLAIFFGSSVIEELVMFKTPFIEYKLDNIQRLPFLRHISYSKNYDSLEPLNNIINDINQLLNNSQNYKFNEIIEKKLFDKNNNSDIIINKLIELYKNKLNIQ